MHEQESTKSIVLVVTVPLAWRGLPPVVIRRKLTEQPHIMEFLAQEVHRWLNTDNLDAREIGQKLIDLNTSEGL